KVAGQLIAGSTLGRVDAGLVISFSKEDAIIFEVRECTSRTIDRMDDFGLAILQLDKQRYWNRDWLVVTEVVQAEWGTLIISGSRSARIDMKAQGTFAPAGLSLADPHARFAITNEQDVACRFIAEHGLTPLYRAGGIERKLLSTRFSSSTREGR